MDSLASVWKFANCFLCQIGFILTTDRVVGSQHWPVLWLEVLALLASVKSSCGNIYLSTYPVAGSLCYVIVVIVWGYCGALGLPLEVIFILGYSCQSHSCSALVLSLVLAIQAFYAVWFGSCVSLWDFV